jgi:protein TonB
MVYYKYEEEPVYKTGIGGMMRFVTANFYITKNEPWQSLFKITFIVDKDGSVVAPRIEGKPVSDYSASEREMIRVFRKMPRWEPGKCNHTKISCLIKTPIILDPSRE